MKIKKIFYILIIVGMIFAIPSALPADSGFDSSYGGGSYGGGSYGGSSYGGSSWDSWDSGSSSHSSGGHSTGGVSSPVADVFFYIIFILCVLFYVIIKINASDRGYSAYQIKNKNNNPVSYDPAIFDKIREVFPNATEDTVINEALEAYKAFSKYINDRDLDGLKTMTSVNLYERMVNTFESFKVNNSYSMVEDITLQKGFIEFIDFYKNILTVKVALNVKEITYFVDEDYEYLRGNKNQIEENAYTVTIQKELGANKIVMTNKVLTSNPMYIISDKDKYTYNSNINLNELLKVDPDLTENNIINKTYEIYEDLQYAWSSFDYDKMRTLISDELYNNYRMQLKTLSTKKQKNVMSDIEFVRGSIKDFEITKTSLNITVELEVTQNDYIVDENGKVLRGDKTKDHNTYELLITRGLNSLVKDKNCPNCGGELSFESSQSCPHCGADLVTLSGEFIIAKKRIIKQR